MYESFPPNVNDAPLANYISKFKSLKLRGKTKWLILNSLSHYLPLVVI
jgi:hypothetical protein